MSAPLDSYNEVHPNHRRTFELFDDRIEIHTKTVREEGHYVVLLKGLRAFPDQVYIRPRGFRLAVAVLLLGIHCLIFSKYLSKFVEFERVICSSVALLFVGGVIAWKTFPKVEFKSFVTNEGGGAFDVARCGPDCQRFDHFVNAIVSRIERLQKTD